PGAGAPAAVRRLHLRLGQAGARHLGKPETSQARHGHGGGGRAVGQPGDGLPLGHCRQAWIHAGQFVCLGRAAHDLHGRRGYRDQRRPDCAQSPAHPGRGRWARAGRVAAGALGVAVEPPGALRIPDPAGSPDDGAAREPAPSSGDPVAGTDVQSCGPIGGILSSTSLHHNRVLSGMRPTGKLHLGHYHGVLKNWVRLQHEYECFFFVADWHALTTEYENPQVVGENVWDMVIDWLAAGVDPKAARLFIQSRVPEHAELHLLLSMMTPLGWLERVPTYKDQQEKLKEKDLSTYGFLGYPLLQSADILIYKASQVPVGEDQVPHVELTREVARRFNHLYGREPDFAEKAEAAAKKMGKKNAKLYLDLRRRYQEQGDRDALDE